MISVIVPAYNAGLRMRDCIESILRQKIKSGFEVIVVDDGSQDITTDIVKLFKSVRLLRQNHKGPAAARNLGAKKSKGDIVVFTDSDCVADKNWLAEMVKPFSRKEIVGVQGAYKTQQKSLVAKFAQVEIEGRYEIMKRQRYIDFIGTYSAAYRKNIFTKFGGFDESFPIASGEDTDLSFRMSRAGLKMAFNPHAIIYHRHPDSMRKYLKQKFWRAYWRVLLYRKNKDKIVKESYTPQVLKIQIGLFYLALASVALTLAGISKPILPTGLFSLLLLSTARFSIFAAKRDLAVGLVSPILVLLRSIVFSFGLAYGMLRVKK